ncbi:MAG TPA: serine/threonine-protein kinase, partial [Thermoanaerobaculia bacterium]|nr:serine/threonine-protein kinase [Thermoanaerobaculia bacterium]
LLADPVYRQRFLSEARLATQIHHPNVAVVHDFSLSENGSSYMVTEFIDGMTLRQWEAANGRFPLELAVEVTLHVLGGLEHIHRRGLLHRDISADNVMLSFDSDRHLQVKIIDLGVAKDVSSEAETTQAGVFMGNPKYMSPEQLGELPEGETLDGRTDLYSLGVVLYEMLAGVPPFQARTASGYIIQHLTATPPRFHDTDPTLDVPPELESIVLRCLEKDRRNRFADARELAAVLSDWVPLTPKPRTLEVSLEERRRVEEAWNAAVAVDTYNAYREFRAKFPSHRVDEAERAIAERLAFDSAAAMDTEDAWSDYLEKYSGDRHAATAEQRLDESRVREETAYSVALSSKNGAAWSAFLEEFPDGKLSAHAQEHLREALMFDAARRGNRLAAFLEAWPDGLLAKDARRLLKVAEDDTDFAQARSIDTAAAWSFYLMKNPAGAHIVEAQTRLDERAWQEAQKSGTPDAVHAYLKSYPNGRFAADARRALARLAIIEGDFNSAWESGTIAAWDEYLARYPASPRAEEARRCRQEAAEYELAASLDTKQMWRAFLKAWPEGRYRFDVEIRLRNS